jgi:hypothetical protein
VVLSLWLAGCGRIAFDPISDASSSRDAAGSGRDGGRSDGAPAMLDAGSPADARGSSDAGRRDASAREDGGAGPCGAPGVIYCDSFEGGGYRPEWSVDSPGTLSVIADPTGDRGNVLKVWLDGTDVSRLIYTIEPPYLGGGELYLQFRARIDGPAAVTSRMTLARAVTGAQALGIHVDAGDAMALSGSFGASTADAASSFPRREWTCVTLRILVTFADGLMDLTVGPRLLQLEPVTTRFAEGYVEISLGLIGADRAQTVYFDDFSFGTSAPPCS